VKHGAVRREDVFSSPVGAVSSPSREITMYSNKKEKKKKPNWGDREGFYCM
jgi:hypothetical protein